MQIDIKKDIKINACVGDLIETKEEGYLRIISNGYKHYFIDSNGYILGTSSTSIEELLSRYTVQRVIKNEDLKLTLK